MFYYEINIYFIDIQRYNFLNFPSLMMYEYIGISVKYIKLVKIVYELKLFTQKYLMSFMLKCFDNRHLNS